MKKLYVLQHAACEPLGIWEEELKRWHARFEYIQLWNGAEVPEAENTLAAIVLGGPMSANDTDQHPYLKQEIAYLKQLMENKTHVLGVCLGAQLMAVAGGGRVYNGPKAEIGYSRVTLTHEGIHDPLLLGFPMDLPVFQWHEQGFEMPPGASRLAGTEEYPDQGFRIGNAWGFQFHQEVTPQLVEEFGQAYTDMLSVIPGLTRKKLTEQATAQGQVAALYGRQVIRRFWDSVTEI